MEADTQNRGLTLSEITPNRFDWPIMAANTYVRRELLNHTTVIDHLLALSDLRAPATDLDGFRAYWRAITASPLLEQFTDAELDHVVSVVDERPVQAWRASQTLSARYGRVRERGRALTTETLDLGIADLVHRIDPSGHPPDVGPRMRKVRQRLRELPGL